MSPAATRTRKSRCVVIAPHALRLVVGGVRAGALPRHHACGIDRLARGDGDDGIRINDPSPLLQRLSNRPWASSIGEHCDPLQLARSMVHAVRHDAVLYALNELCFAAAAPERLLASRRPHTVALVHGEEGRPHLARWLDGAMCLTDETAERVDALRVKHVRRLRWGPDLAYDGYIQDPPESFTIVSLGRAGRDPAVLLRALASVGDVPAVIDASMSSMSGSARSLDDVASEVAGLGGFDASSYARPAHAFRSASVFVIPLLREYPTPVGLTEVNDALALGRPIVMTRSRGLGLDIAAEGFGMWVRPGDADGLGRAIATLRDDRDMRLDMGRKARAFAEKKWNYALFCADFEDFMALPRSDRNVR